MRLLLKYGVLFAIVFSFSACDELLDDLISFDSDYTEVNFKIYPQSETGEVTFTEDVIMSELDELLEDNDLDRDNITSILLKEAVFNVTNDDASITFDGISAVKAAFVAGTHPEVVVAEKDPVPSGARSVSLDVNSTDLEKYIKEAQYTIMAKGVINAPITDTIFVTAKLKYTVKGGL